MSYKLSLNRRRASRASAAIVVALAAIAALFVAVYHAPAARANTSTLNQVSSFGSNPGGLQMFDYVPTTAAANAPLVLALHGCTQSASAYYSDSGWPKYADMWGFDLVFPQDSSSSSNDCFDWFTSSDDTRGNGQAESIIQMVQYMESTYSINPSRVYITGLSAGGGMTADLLADYPDVFASGSIDSGLPAQCATSGTTSAYTCMDGPVNNSVAQWAALATNSDPGYTGTWPTVQVWQGTADTVVSTANSTELMDQWTGVWGISQTASATASLPGGTSESIYNDSAGNPVVEVFAISGMGHGLAVNPGSATDQCGATGAYFLNYICSTYYTALFWGLNNTSTTSASPSASASASVSASASPSVSPSQSASSSSSPSSTYTATCYTASNYQQTVDGRAYELGGYTYADGSNQNMGLWNVYYVTTLEETAPGYYIINNGTCP